MWRSEWSPEPVDGAATAVEISRGKLRLATGAGTAGRGPRGRTGSRGVGQPHGSHMTLPRRGDRFNSRAMGTRREAGRTREDDEEPDVATSSSTGALSP